MPNMSVCSENLLTSKESQKIIDNITKNNLYSQLQDDSIWIEMENNQLCPGRSWYSMKEHFQEFIIRSLNSFAINEKERNEILKWHSEIIDCPEKVISRLDNPSTIERENVSHSKCETKMSPYLFGINIMSYPDEQSDYKNEKIIKCGEEIVKTEILDNKATFPTKSDVSPTESTEMRYMEFEQEQENGGYSEEEDRCIVEYMKNNINFTTFNDFNQIYENCQKEILNKHSVASIKNRYLNVILPKLHTYRIVDIVQIPLFYDRAGVDIPHHLVKILCDLLEEKTKICSLENEISSKVCESKISEENCFPNYPKEIENCFNRKESNINTMNTIFHYDQYKENKEYNLHGKQVSDVGVQTVLQDIYFVAKIISNDFYLKINNEEHLFVNEINAKQRVSTGRKNIHLINNALFEDLKSIKILNDLFEERILDVLKHSESEFSAHQFSYKKNIPYSACSCDIPPKKGRTRNSSRKVHLPLPSNLKHILRWENLCKCKERIKIKKYNSKHPTCEKFESQCVKKYDVEDTLHVDGNLFIEKESISKSNNTKKSMNTDYRCSLTSVLDDISDHPSPVNPTSEKKQKCPEMSDQTKQRKTNIADKKICNNIKQNIAVKSSSNSPNRKFSDRCDRSDMDHKKRKIKTNNTLTYKDTSIKTKYKKDVLGLDPSGNNKSSKNYSKQNNNKCIPSQKKCVNNDKRDITTLYRKNIILSKKSEKYLKENDITNPRVMQFSKLTNLDERENNISISEEK